MVRLCYKWLSDMTKSQYIFIIRGFTSSFFKASFIFHYEFYVFKCGKLWGGRFTMQNDPIMEKFNASISYDKRMWKEDITGSKVYASALYKANMLTKDEADDIIKGMLNHNLQTQFDF